MERGELPYFDQLFDSLESPESEFLKIMGLYFHWGYWPDPERADMTVQGTRAAMEGLTTRLMKELRIRPGMKVLDVGCGLGGTIDYLNQKHNGLDLTGLNIDPRQIELARNSVKARPENQVSFVVGDACELPFADDSIDQLSAVECIFHFPSREEFLREAMRVLKPGGRLVFSDFIAYLPIALFLWPFTPSAKPVFQVYGNGTNTLFLNQLSYEHLLRKTGFRMRTFANITRHTMPTFKVLHQLFRDRDPAWRELWLKANESIRFSMKWGALRYGVVAVEKPAGKAGKIRG